MHGNYLVGLMAAGAAACAVAACSDEPSSPAPAAAAQSHGMEWTTRRPRLGPAFVERAGRFETHGSIRLATHADGFELMEGDSSFRVSTPSGDAWSPRSGRLERRATPNVTEQLVSLRQGAQLIWSVAAAPEGSRFEAVLDVHDAKLVQTDQDGFVFARRGRAFRVSHGSWLDARGQHTRIEASFAQGRLRYRVPRAVLEASKYPARLDPVISAELFAAPALDATGFGDGEVAKVLERSNGDALFFTPTKVEVRGVDTTDGSVTLAFNASSLFADLFDIQAVDVALLGEDLAIAWVQGGTVNVRRVDLTTLDWKDAAPVVASDILNNLPGTGDGQLVQVASSGSSLLVTWPDQVNLGTTAIDVGYALLDSSSLAKTASGFLATSSTDYPNDVPLRVAADDSGSFAVMAVAGAADVSGDPPGDVRVFAVSSAGALAGTFEAPTRAGLGDLVRLPAGFGFAYGDMVNGGGFYQALDSNAAASGAAVSVGNYVVPFTSVGFPQVLVEVPGQGILTRGSVPRLIAGGSASAVTAPSWFTDQSVRLQMVGLSTGAVASARFDNSGSLGATLTYGSNTLTAGSDYPVGNRFVEKGEELAATYDSTTGSFFVVWNETNAAGLQELRLAAYDAFSTTRKLGPVTLHTQGQPNDFYSDLDVVSEGGNLVAKWTLWRRDNNLFIPLLQRFSLSDGSAVDVSPVALAASSIGGSSGDAPKVVLAWGAGTVHASWADFGTATATRVSVDVSGATLTPQTTMNAEVLPYGPQVGDTFAGFSLNVGSAIYGTALTAASKVQDLCTTASGGSAGAGEDFRDARIVAGDGRYFLACGSVCELVEPDGTVTSQACDLTGRRLSGYAAPHYLLVAGSGDGFGGPGGLANNSWPQPIAGDPDATWVVESIFQDGTVMPSFNTVGSVAVDPLHLNRQVVAAGPGAMLLGYLGEQVGAGVNQVILRWIDPGTGLSDGCTDDDDCASGLCDNGSCAIALSGSGGTGGSATGGTGGASAGGAGGSSTGGVASGGTGNAGSSSGGSGNAGAGPGGAGNSGSGGATSGGSSNGGSSSAGSGNAGSGNAGSNNAGSSNAGSGNAGSSNAGSNSDGGTSTATPSGSKDEGGCGCAVPGQRSSTGALGAFGLTLLGLAGWRRRRDADC